MAIDTVTVTLLNSTLGSPTARKLFTRIAANQIALYPALKEASPNADEELSALQSADLIGADSSGQKFYVTAKGLKVARDLQQLPI